MVFSDYHSIYTLASGCGTVESLYGSYVVISRIGDRDRSVRVQHTGGYRRTTVNIVVSDREWRAFAKLLMAEAAKLSKVKKI